MMVIPLSCVPLLTLIRSAPAASIAFAILTPSSRWFPSGRNSSPLIRTLMSSLGQDARIPEESDDRFGMINRIAMLSALDREEEALESLEKYDYTAHLVKQLFRTQQEE